MVCAMSAESREAHRKVSSRNYQSEEYKLSSNPRRVGSPLDNLRPGVGMGRCSSAGTSLWVTEKWHAARAYLKTNHIEQLWTATAAHCSINARKLGYNGHAQLSYSTAIAAAGH